MLLVKKLDMRLFTFLICLFAVAKSASGQADYLKSHRYWDQHEWYSEYIIFENDSLVRFSLPYGYNGFNERRISDKGIVSFHGDTLFINRKFEKLKKLNVYAEECRQPRIGTTIYYRGIDSFDSLIISVLDESQLLKKKISIKAWDDSVFLECPENYKFIFSNAYNPDETVTINSEYLSNKKTTILLNIGHQVDDGIWKFLVVKNDYGISLIGPLLGDHQKRNRQCWKHQFIHQWPWKWTKLSEEHLYDPIITKLTPSDSVYPFVFEDMEVFESDE